MPEYTGGFTPEEIPTLLKVYKKLNGMRIQEQGRTLKSPDPGVQAYGSAASYFFDVLDGLGYDWDKEG